MEAGRPELFSVNFFHRKPHAVGNYSVEFIFDDVRSRLSEKINASKVYSPYESAGLFKRFYNALHAAFHQGDVNHVTGDINYIGIFLHKSRTIQTILDCVHMETSSGLKHQVLKFFWITLPVRRCRFVTAISESTKREILKYAHCDPGKIIVIPVAVSKRFKPKPRAFNKQKPVLLQLGTAPNKNIPRLIEAVKDIPCILQIVGKHNPQYEEMLKNYGIEYRYDWGLTDQQILEKYEQADMVTFTSTYEGFGMPILEGQSVGRPVITSKLLSMPEVAGDAAKLVDPYDPQDIRRGILQIIEQDQYREGLIARGFENVKRYDPERIALMYYDLYAKTNKKP